MNRTQHIAYFKVPYKQKDKNNDNFCCGDKKSSKGDGITDNEDPELNQFYYHSDHLGSSSYITNLSGNIVQHVEYVPFGEVFLEERNNKWNTPYLFNGKELDEETGLYYYGARYYSSRNSIFLSVDPLWEAKPSFSPYNYCSWNPVMRVDPDGRLDDWFENEKTGAIYYNSDMRKGDETKLGENWKHMGENGMFSDETPINNDVALLARNNNLTHIEQNNDGSISSEGYMKGEKAKSFMDKQGYDFKPTQQTVLNIKPVVKMNKAPRQPSIEVRITEKSRYMKDKYSTGGSYISPIIMINNKFGNSVVGRQKIYYSNKNSVEVMSLRVFNIFYPSMPVTLNSWSEYQGNSKIINQFRRNYGEH